MAVGMNSHRLAAAVLQGVEKIGHAMAYTPYPHIGKGRLRRWLFPRATVTLGSCPTTPHTHSPAEKRALLLRLRKIGGQIAAIERMIEADRDCPEVLMQVVSVRKALKSFAQVVIHQHAPQCIEGAAEPKVRQRKLHDC